MSTEKDYLERGEANLQKTDLSEVLEDELNLERGSLRSIWKANKPHIISILVGVRKLKEQIKMIWTHPSLEQYVLDAVEQLQDAYKNKDGMSEYEIERFKALEKAFGLGGR